MKIAEMLAGLTDEFCIAQFEKYILDPSQYQTEIRALIDQQAPALKAFLYGLAAHLGAEAVLGATTVLALLLQGEWLKNDPRAQTARIQ